MIDGVLEGEWDAQSLSRLFELERDVAGLGGILSLELNAQLAILAHEFAAALAHEFHHAAFANKAGRTDHDRTGTDDDRSEWVPGYVHTIDTIEVNVAGLIARIQMAGGAVFVEYPVQGHPIDARNAPYLKFRINGGRWVQVEHVEHPEWPGDDFVGRSFEDLHIAAAFASILTKVRVVQWATGFSDTQRSLT